MMAGRNDARQAKLFFNSGWCCVFFFFFFLITKPVVVWCFPVKSKAFLHTVVVLLSVCCLPRLNIISLIQQPSCRSQNNDHNFIIYFFWRRDPLAPLYFLCVYPLSFVAHHRTESHQRDANTMALPSFLPIPFSFAMLVSFLCFLLATPVSIASESGSNEMEVDNIRHLGWGRIARKTAAVRLHRNCLCIYLSVSRVHGTIVCLNYGGVLMFHVQFIIVIF